MRKRSEDGELLKLEQFVERLQAQKNALEKSWNKEARAVPGLEKGNAEVQGLGKDGQRNSMAAPQGSFSVITGFLYGEHADISRSANHLSG